MDLFPPADFNESTCDRTLLGTVLEIHGPGDEMKGFAVSIITALVAFSSPGCALALTSTST
jgi:hypothetical protein